MEYRASYKSVAHWLSYNNCMHRKTNYAPPIVVRCAHSTTIGSAPLVSCDAGVI